MFFGPDRVKQRRLRDSAITVSDLRIRQLEHLTKIACFMGILLQETHLAIPAIAAA